MTQTKTQKALALIKKGVALNDEELIQMGNELLLEYKKSFATGDLIHHNDTEPANISPDENGYITQAIDPDKPRTRADGKTYARRAGAVQAGENKWTDDGTEGNDEGNEILKKFTRQTKRNRPPAQKKEVVCARCNKKEFVTPALYRSYYVCSRCAAGR